MNVVANGFNEYGDPCGSSAPGLMARCCQHETDHLDGILFLDRLDAQARKAAMKEIRQAPWYDAANPPDGEGQSPRDSTDAVARACAASSPVRRTQRCPSLEALRSPSTRWSLS
jgi:peptide deformylase